MRWTVNKAQSDYMAVRQRQNRATCASNRNENQVFDALKTTGLKWTRQARWGCRLFDFWCHERGIAVEVDGPEHSRAYDAARDRYNFLRSAIIVIRVPNRDGPAIAAALIEISAQGLWAERREKMGLTGGYKARRQNLISEGLPLAHGDWVVPIV